MWQRLLVALLVLTAVLVPAAAAGAAPTAATSYVALGDSYTAGPLVPPPDPVTPGCSRSLNNYPHLLASRYQITNLKDVSCAGADTADMFAPQAVQGGANPPQLDAVDATTRLVTVQIGGNDIGFSEIVTNCAALLPIGTPCRNRYAPGGIDQIGARIQATRPKVDAVLAAIRAKAPAAAVYLIGYPSILPENSPGCWPSMPYTAEDVPYLIGIEKALNTTLSESAAAHGAVYVDLYTPSLGHDACRLLADRWVEPVLLPVLGAAVHPNLVGMIAAQYIVGATVDATMP